MIRTKKLSLSIWIILLLVTACNRSKDNHQTGEHTPEKAEELMVLHMSSLAGSFEIPGELLPYEAVDIYPRANGFIRMILVDRGSEVRKGDVLAIIDAPEVEAALAESKALVGSAESQVQLKMASFGISRDTYQRMLRTSRIQGAVSENELLKYQTRVTEDSLGYLTAVREHRAAAAVSEAKQTFAEYLTIRAPFDGIVTDRMVHTGALVKADHSKPLFRINNISRLRLELALPEAYAGKTIVGDTVYFTTNVYGGEVFPGVIQRQSRSLNPVNRVEMVEADVQNPDKRLQSGMFAKAVVKYRLENVWLVPSSAVITTLQERFVVSIKSGAHEKIPVTIGLQSGGQSQIWGAINPGEVILTNAKDFYQ